MPYNPKPPRLWSRVQNPFVDNTNLQNLYKEKLLSKGNVLQYKNNSSNETKKQKYSKIARGVGPGRTKVFATQSEKYTNPNTNSFLRTGSRIIPFPNYVVGEPNNISGPYSFNVPNPDNCNNDGSLEDGGTLVAGSYVKPCTDIILSNGKKKGDLIYNSSSSSDVPGRVSTLGWDPSLQPWFPRYRYIMPTAGGAWPKGAKIFISALTPYPPVIELNSNILSWTYVQSYEIPTTSFNIYVNNLFFTSVIYQITTYTFSTLNTNDKIYVKSLSQEIQSDPSNTVIYV